MFWLIVGLIESGSLVKADQFLRNFHPSDNKLFLAIHLGCYLITHLRITTKEQKEIASRISDKLAGRIIRLREQLVSELKTELLEMRQGKICAIEDKKPDETE